MLTEIAPIARTVRPPGNDGSAVGTSAEPTTRPTQSSPACSADASPCSHGYHNSIAVLGHSGATGGETSDAPLPGIEVRENSWPTGTNPVVNSLYLRILFPC